VLLALAVDEIGVRVRPVRLLELAAGDGDLRCGQVRAGEMARQVGRRELEGVVGRSLTKLGRSGRFGLLHQGAQLQRAHYADEPAAGLRRKSRGRLARDSGGQALDLREHFGWLVLDVDRGHGDLAIQVPNLVCS
jgi:hypothetical protein